MLPALSPPVSLETYLYHSSSSSFTLSITSTSAASAAAAALCAPAAAFSLKPARANTLSLLNLRAGVSKYIYDGRQCAGPRARDSRRSRRAIGYSVQMRRASASYILLIYRRCNYPRRSPVRARACVCVVVFFRRKRERKICCIALNKVAGDHPDGRARVARR